MMQKHQGDSRTARAAGLLIAALAMLVSCGSSGSDAAQEMAASVSQHGITWYFDQEYPVGRYANGDWWVLGPVTITKITPESGDFNGRVMHGSQLNPPNSGRQGYDSNTSNRMAYVSDLNVAPSVSGPLAVTTGSIVSAISDPAPDSPTMPIAMLAILTVVDHVPSTGAFRPPPYIDDKTSYWNESQLNYGVLQSLPKVESTPDIDSLAENALKFWNEQGTNWSRAYVMANHRPGYGRDLANLTSTMVLALHLDFSDEEKRDLLVGLVQYGIDNYGKILAGGNWHADGGWHHGRKVPTLLAGLALNDSSILHHVNRETGGANLFQEDGQTFIVAESDVGRPTEEEFPRHATWEEERMYLPEDVGNAEWAIRYWQRDREWGDRRWGSSYRWVGSQFVGIALAARLMDGGYDAWNWPPFFEYVERYLDVGPIQGIPAFHQELWGKYRDIDAQTYSFAAPPAAPILQSE